GLGGHDAVAGDPLDAGVVVALEVAVAVQALGALAVLGLGVGEEPGLEVLEAGPDLDLPVDGDDAAAARTQDQHLRGVAGDLAVGRVVEHRAGLNPAVQGQVVDVAVGVGVLVVGRRGVGGVVGRGGVGPVGRGGVGRVGRGGVGGGCGAGVGAQVGARVDARVGGLVRDGGRGR